MDLQKRALEFQERMRPPMPDDRTGHVELARGEPTDPGHRDRSYHAFDPAGHRWIFATPTTPATP